MTKKMKVNNIYKMDLKKILSSRVRKIPSKSYRYRILDSYKNYANEKYPKKLKFFKYCACIITLGCDTYYYYWHLRNFFGHY